MGRGTLGCGGEAVEMLYLKVCLHRSSGGAWVKVGCRDNVYAAGQDEVSKRIAEPCIRQQTTKYRILARGAEWDGPDFDRDSAKATSILYCPGTSADGGASDGVEYAESWLPD